MKTHSNLPGLSDTPKAKLNLKDSVAGIREAEAEPVGDNPDLVAIKNDDIAAKKFALKRRQDESFRAAIIDTLAPERTPKEQVKRVASRTKAAAAHAKLRLAENAKFEEQVQKLAAAQVELDKVLEQEREIAKQK